MFLLFFNDNSLLLNPFLYESPPTRLDFSQSSIFPSDRRDASNPNLPPPTAIIPDARPLSTFENQDGCH